MSICAGYRRVYRRNTNGCSLRKITVALIVILTFLGICGAFSLPVNAIERRTLTHDSIERSYLIQKPTWHRSSKDPVIVLLHPSLATAETFLDRTNFKTLAQREAAILVAPDGINNTWDAHDPEHGIDDIGFIGKILDEIIGGDNADETRIYVTGMSAGGDLSFLLACEMADRITAIAPVANELQEEIAANCHSQRPMPMMFVMGTADAWVPYEGGCLAFNHSYLFLSAPETLEVWADRNGCQSGPKITNLPNFNWADFSTVCKVSYYDCLGNVETVLYKVQGGGHTWPGGKVTPAEALVLGATNQDIKIEEVVWRFFRRTPANTSAKRSSFAW